MTDHLLSLGTDNWEAGTQEEYDAAFIALFDACEEAGVSMSDVMAATNPYEESDWQHQYDIYTQ